MRIEKSAYLSLIKALLVGLVLVRCWSIYLLGQIPYNSKLMHCSVLADTLILFGMEMLKMSIVGSLPGHIVQLYGITALWHYLWIGLGQSHPASPDSL
jgi:hypothetical protein